MHSASSSSCTLRIDDASSLSAGVLSHKAAFLQFLQLQESGVRQRVNKSTISLHAVKKVMLISRCAEAEITYLQRYALDRSKELVRSLDARYKNRLLFKLTWL